jgi:hypothetical protein
MRYKLVCHFEMTDNLVISSLKEQKRKKEEKSKIYLSTAKKYTHTHTAYPFIVQPPISLINLINNKMF